MAKRMKALNLNELSAVPRGANQGAHFLLAKAHQDTPIERLIAKVSGLLKGRGDQGLSPTEIAALAKESTDFATATAENAQRQAIWKMLDALQVALVSILCPDDDDTTTPADRATALRTTLEQFTTAATGLEGLTKAADAAHSPTENDMTPEEVTLMVNKAVDGAVGKAVESAVAKATEPLTAEIATLKTANESHVATIAKQDTALKELATAQADSALVAKAHAIVGDAPVDPTVVAGILKQLDPAGQDAVAAILKTAGELSNGSGLFKQFSGAGSLGDNDAATQITKAADALRAADPKLTEAAAISKALEANPDLYDAYEASLQEA